MKKLSTSIAAVLAAASFVDGGIIFSEDFGTIADGTTLTDSNTGYDNVRNNNFDAVALNPSTIGSGASMSYGGATGGSNENFYVDYGAGSLDVTTTTFSLKGSSLSGGDWIYFEGGDGDSNTMFSNAGFASAEMFWGIQSNDGALEYRASGWQSASFTLTDDTAYDFHIVANRSGSTISYGSESVANNSIDLYINGTLIGNDLAAESSVNSIGMKLYQVNGGTSFEFDNHVVYNEAVAVPEPSVYAAALGLLALGFVAWRRRR